ncbi:MAG: carbonic anhydrase [Nitratireductor sp.]
MKNWRHRPEARCHDHCLLRSRAAPELIFGQRRARSLRGAKCRQYGAAYAPDDEYHGTSAALEFAVQELKVKHVVVVGHGKCGGVNAFREQMEGNTSEPLSPGDFIPANGLHCWNRRRAISVARMPIR